MTAGSSARSPSAARGDELAVASFNVENLDPTDRVTKFDGSRGSS